MKKNSKTAASIWISGLSGSGKSTLATGLSYFLESTGKQVVILDGDVVRKGINRDLGYSTIDRMENIRRVAEMTKLFSENGIITVCAFITPTEEIRKIAKRIIGEENYIQVYAKATLKKCRERDTKSLYQKAIKGEIENFTGISSEYDAPANPDIVIPTDIESISSCMKLLIEQIQPIIENE